MFWMSMAVVFLVVSLTWLYKFITEHSSLRTVKDFDKKCVLITGCGSGFGLLAAEKLDKLGFRVIATCRTKEGEENVRKKCSERVKTFKMDVTLEEDLKGVLNEVKKELSSSQGLWGLVNNAGVMQIGPIEWQSLDDFRRTADVNLWGTIAVTKTFLPLVKQGNGRIVNMGSTTCRMALPYMTSYTISKHGVDAFTDSLRREMAFWDIHVISIEAGGHKTKLVDGKRLAQQWTTLWDELDKDIKQDYAPESGNTGAKEMLRFDSVMSYHCDDVVNAMVTALTCQSPKIRYLVGVDAKAFMFLSFLPSFIMDWMIGLGIYRLKPNMR